MTLYFLKGKKMSPKCNLSVHVNPKLHKTLKYYCFDNNTTIRKVLTEALEIFFKKGDTNAE